MGVFGLLILALAGGCALFRPATPPPDVPAVLPREDLARAASALEAAPNSLAVFEPELAAAPLDIARSAVVIDLDRQRAYVYSQSRLVAATRLASGRRGYRTPTGDYKLGQRNIDHASNLYGKFVDSESGEVVARDVDMRVDEPPEGAEFVGAPMRYFMRFHELDGTYTAVGMHAGRVPRHPASHGCIRLPGSAARALWALLPRGLPVHVYGEKFGQPARPLPQEEAREKDAA